MTYLDCMLIAHKELGIDEEKSKEIIKYADIKLVSVGGNPDTVKNTEVSEEESRDIIDHIKMLCGLPREVINRQMKKCEQELSVNNKNN